MCGIVGASQSAKTRNFILGGLKALEYRGYDSAGALFSTTEGPKLYRTLSLDALEQAIPQNMTASTAIGHTRWATNGEPKVTNAHPIPSYDRSIYVIHNGVLTNATEIRERLKKTGVPFSGETDTEVLASYIAYQCQTGLTVLEALRRAEQEFAGQMAVLFIAASAPNNIYFVRRGSPLLLAKGRGQDYYFASDIWPLADYADEIAEIPQGSLGYVGEGELYLEKSGKRIKPSFTSLGSEVRADSLGAYPHYMLKEIEEEPAALGKLKAECEVLKTSPNLQPLLALPKILLLGSGTSYHAAVLAQSFLETPHNSVEAIPASEFVYSDRIPEKTLLILVSQSGETYDLIRCLEKVRRDKDNTVLALVNAKRSTIERQSDLTIDIKAGREVAVASTKAYVSEVAALYAFGQLMNGKPYEADLTAVQRELSKVAEVRDRIRQVALRLSGTTDAFFVARGRDVPLAMEASLKLKEVSYIHSEWVLGGELKHGPIALIDENFLSVFIITDPRLKAATLGSISEIKARKGKVLVLSTVGPLETEDGYQISFSGPLAGLPLMMWCQYFTYYMALIQGRNVDKPRNLAKSVTVE